MLPPFGKEKKNPDNGGQMDRKANGNTRLIHTSYASCVKAQRLRKKRVKPINDTK